MQKNRLEAFSDGVIAIILTIMVLEMKVPHGSDFADLLTLLPVFLSYILSFVFIGIYWNNHHHLLHVAKKINGAILWANLHLLFWLTLIPFVTGWMGENHFATLPVAMYGVVMLMAGIAYWILAHCLVAYNGKDSALARAIGSDAKGLVSIIVYFFAIPLAFVNTWIAGIAYVAIAILWLIPDRRIEKIIERE